MDNYNFIKKLLKKQPNSKKSSMDKLIDSIEKQKLKNKEELYENKRMYKEFDPEDANGGDDKLLLKYLLDNLREKAPAKFYEKLGKVSPDVVDLDEVPF